MGLAKNITVKPISSKDAIKIIKQIHYSGLVINNSILHFGVFIGGRCEGAISFGPSMDKKRMMATIPGTGWSEFIELNRMAFSESLPRNSESRALGIVLRLIRKEYSHIKWVVSFSDGTQCGDGTIYRASGFNLIGIKKNSSLWRSPSGIVYSRMTLTAGLHGGRCEEARREAKRIIGDDAIKYNKGGASMKLFKAAGFIQLAGFQLKYIYFFDKDLRERESSKFIPFSEIERVGAKMYKGKRA